MTNLPPLTVKLITGRSQKKSDSLIEFDLSGIHPQAKRNSEKYKEQVEKDPRTQAIISECKWMIIDYLCNGGRLELPISFYDPTGTVISPLVGICVRNMIWGFSKPLHRGLNVTLTHKDLQG